MKEILSEYDNLFGGHGDAIKALAGEGSPPSTMKGSVDDLVRLMDEMNAYGRANARPRERAPRLNTRAAYALWNKRQPEPRPKGLDAKAIWDRWNRRAS